MGVVMVTNRGPGAMREGSAGVGLAPARPVGIVPGATSVRLVAVAAFLCAAVVVAVSLTPSQAPGGGGARASVAVGAGPALPIVPVGAVGPISAALGRDLPGYRVVRLTVTNAEQDLRAAEIDWTDQYAWSPA